MGFYILVIFDVLDFEIVDCFFDVFVFGFVKKSTKNKTERFCSQDFFSKQFKHILINWIKHIFIREGGSDHDVGHTKARDRTRI